MHSEEIHDAFISPYIFSMIRTMRMNSTGYVLRTGWRELLAGLWRERRRFEEINNIDIKELGWGGVACIRLA